MDLVVASVAKQNVLVDTYSERSQEKNVFSRGLEKHVALRVHAA